MLSVKAAFKSRARVKDIPKVVEFYPLENISPVEMGYLYSGIITSEMIVSYIYKWASDGYLKIIIPKDEIDAEGKKIKKRTSKESIILEKVMDLDKGPSFERILFKDIFYYSSGSPRRVSNVQLKHKLVNSFSNLKRGVEKKYKNDNKFNKRRTSSASDLMLIIISILLVVSTVCADGAFNGISDRVVLAFLFIIFMVSSRSEMTYDFNKSFKENLKNNNGIIYIIIYTILFYVLLFFFEANYIVVKNCIKMASLLFAAVIFAIMIQPEKSDYEEQLYGRICGFREFIEHAEKDKLEMLIDEDPNYFYNILPYAQALEVTEVWSDKFKDIDVKKSDYYSCEYNRYVYVNLSNRLTDTVKSAGTSKSSSNSGFSGGGCSGGCSGGGGGSSW